MIPVFIPVPRALVVKQTIFLRSVEGTWWEHQLGGGRSSFPWNKTLIGEIQALQRSESLNPQRRLCRRVLGLRLGVASPTARGCLLLCPGTAGLHRRSVTPLGCSRPSDFSLTPAIPELRCEGRTALQAAAGRPSLQHCGGRGDGGLAGQGRTGQGRTARDREFNFSASPTACRVNCCLHKGTRAKTEWGSGGICKLHPSLLPPAPQMPPNSQSLTPGARLTRQEPRRLLP